MWRQVSQAADKQGDIDNVVRAMVLLKIEEENSRKLCIPGDTSYNFGSGKR